MQAVAPATENVPDAQIEHAVRPDVGVYVPALHTLQLPCVKYCPAGHSGVQADAPDVEENDPVEQMEQVLAPVMEE